jgi:hypothetical protein
MQFTVSDKSGTDFSIVEFAPHSVTGASLYNICESFIRLGGRMGSTVSNWEFPNYITEEVIKEVISNTCFKCGGLMEDGIAMVNGTLKVESYDSAVDTYQGTIEYRDPKNFKQIKVRKCQTCGHSHT